MIGLFSKMSVPDWLLHCVTNRREHDANGKLANQIAKLQAIEDITWPRGDAKFLFEC